MNGVKEIWTDEQIDFLIKSFPTMTSYELSDKLGKSRSIVRMKYKELGLKKIELEYWSEKMVAFLKSKYRSIGDTEIAEIFQSKFPKKKRWSKRHIGKKRKQLKLFRTPDEIMKIKSEHVKPGGRSYTINRNSCSKNMHPNWIAQIIAGKGRKDLALELRRHPQLIEAKRQQIMLQRKINERTGQ